ncbi:MAG TPA: branched-chain amino acid ABC transporter permease [Ktedonobacterales bacterium]|jgi:branched-chain amino acid transport system permease protein
MADFITYSFIGLAIGCIYALIALGFAIIYKASEVINFAQGELLLVGAYVASYAMYTWRLAFPLALLVAIAVTVAIGLLFERFALRRMIGRPVFSIVMITIGLDVLLRTGVTVRLGATQFLNAATPFGSVSQVRLGGVVFNDIDITIIAATLVCCAALFLFFNRTRYGLAMRATALDQEAALAVGIDVRTVYAMAWGLAGAVAAIGGVLLAARQGSGGFDVGLGQSALLAFPAIILGGLDSIPGAVVGGVLIGLTYGYASGYELRVSWLGAGFETVAPYLVMLVVLLVRPYGLFGSRKVERV